MSSLTMPNPATMMYATYGEAYDVAVIMALRTMVPTTHIAMPRVEIHKKKDEETQQEDEFYVPTIIVMPRP